MAVRLIAVLSYNCDNDKWSHHGAAPATRHWRCRQLYGYPDIDTLDRHDGAAPLPCAASPLTGQSSKFVYLAVTGVGLGNYKVPPAQPLHRAASWLLTGPGLSVNTGGSCDYSDVVQQTIITICLSSVLHNPSPADPLVLNQCFGPLPCLAVSGSQNLCNLRFHHAQV